MKFGPIRGTKERQKIDDGVMSANRDVIVIFPIDGQIGQFG